MRKDGRQVANQGKKVGANYGRRVGKGARKKEPKKVSEAQLAHLRAMKQRSDEVKRANWKPPRDRHGVPFFPDNVEVQSYKAVREHGGVKELYEVLQPTMLVFFESFFGLSEEYFTEVAQQQENTSKGVKHDRVGT